MDSYPYQRNQMMSIPYYYPSGQTARPHLNVDPARSMVPCEPWPFGGNQGYTYPEFHGCCYHNYQPSCYAFRPPYPYVAPHHCPATYSAYAVHYVPPPYFSTDQPRYEFEKNLPTQHHYCGCSNHPCKQNENMKIVEHDDDSDRNNAQAMVPINAQGHPYPVVWLPYGDARREHAKPYKSEREDREEAYNEAKPSHDLESSELPIVWNGWSPLNMKRSEGMKKGEDSQTNRKKQDDNSMSFPFPIFWMPYKPENTRKMERQGSDFGHSSEQELASNIESMHKDKDDNNTFKSMKNEVSTGNNENMVNKESFRKIIPVKQWEENGMKWTSDKNEEKSMNASTNHTNDFGDKKLDENGAKKVPSPKKPSELAPVCLRVGPLPRKKDNNGGSRSPSPPGGKGKSQDVTKDKPVNREISEIKGPVTCGLPDGANEVEESKCKTKTTKGTEGTTQGDEQKDLNVGCTDSTSRSDNQIGNGGVEAPFEPEKKRPGESTQCDNTEGQIKKQLSEDEAATVIQSAYRAYEVRKWEPLKKLKQIANVGEQVAELRGHIQALEHSSDKMVDNKQKIVIAETIMSLLLKLDTIQGLHPTVRDIRKSVARELVSLQEKLDSIPDSSSQVVTELPIKAEDTMRVHESVAVVQGDRDTNTMEQCEDESLAVESSETMVVNGQGNNEESQPISKELEVKDILEHEQCVSSPHRPTEELSYCDGDGEKIDTTSKEMDEHVKNLVDLSQEDNTQDIKDLAEIDTDFSQENITGCVLDEESTTGNNTGMPQDEASRGLEAEPPLGKEIIEQLVPVNSNPDNNMEWEEKEVKDVNSCQIAVEAQAENEVAELPELNDKGGIEENKEIVGSIKGQLDEFSSILQQEVIDEKTKLNKAEEVVEVAVEKTQGAADKDPESIDLKPIDIQVDDQKLQEENNNVAAESGSRDAKAASGSAPQVENFDWPEANEQDITASQISIQSEDSSKKLIEENEKLRKLMEEMIESGKEQLTTISTLSSRLNQLEKKLSRKKKLKMRQRRAAQIKSYASSQVM